MAYKNSSALALAALLMVACVGAQLSPLKTDLSDSTTTDLPHPLPTTTSTSTSTSTSTTTSTSTSTSTAKPAPVTTPSTTAEPTTSTTAEPTTTVKPTPTPAPTPTPEPALNHWTYSENNVTCLIVQMAARLNLTYVTVDDKSANVLYNLPLSNNTTNGQCGNTTDFVKVGLGGQDTLALEFRFVTNDSSRYELKLLELEIDASQFVNAKPNQTIKLFNTIPQFQTHTENSYHCTRVQQLNLTVSAAENATIGGQLAVSRLQLEAFHRSHDERFSTAHDCDSVDTPDIVPIAVGCALAALVALVLIAYLCGRRRRQTRGYLSM